VTHRTIMRLH